MPQNLEMNVKKAKSFQVQLLLDGFMGEMFTHYITDTHIIMGNKP